MAIVREREAPKEAPEQFKLKLETVALLEFFETEIVRKRILPLEERMKRMEDRLDYLLSQMVSDITKNAVTAAYQLATAEIKDTIAKEVKDALARELSNYAKEIEELKRGMNEAVKQVAIGLTDLEQRIAQMVERMSKVEPIDVKKLASEIKPTIDESVISELVNKIKASTDEMDTRVNAILRKFDTIHMLMDRLNSKLTAALDVLESQILHPPTKPELELPPTEEEEAA